MLIVERLKALLPERWHREHPVVPVVRLSGPIGLPGGLRQSLSVANVGPLIERAFSVRRSAAVALIVNSPGGSPVQSRLIFERIRRLADEKDKPVHVIVEDVAASGGYLIALAGDDITVDPSSIVGSIGVVSAGFGFDRLIDKIGVERRVHTVGENKAMLDPFRPEKPEDVRRLKAIQKEIQGVFLDIVKTRRGDRLSGSDKLLFSGEFWAGGRAVELGLADRVGDIHTVMKERYGEKVRLLPVGVRRTLLAPRLPGLSSGGSAAWGEAAQGLVAAIEARLMWSRFGL